jgi:predicted nucleic acid-binding protein
VSFAYDAGVLIAAERNDLRTWTNHRLRLSRGVIPLTTAPVVAQVSRSVGQSGLRRFLRGCYVVDFTAAQAGAVGALLASSGTSDVVDAHLVLTAATTGAAVITADPEDIAILSSYLSVTVPVLRI